MRTTHPATSSDQISAPVTDVGTLASGTYFLDDAAAAAAAVRDSATGIGRYDGVHFNDTGRLFLVQLSLNWMRQWQRGAGVLAS